MKIVQKQIRIIKKLIPKLHSAQRTEVLGLWRDTEACNEDLKIVIKRCHFFIKQNNKILRKKNK